MRKENVKKRFEELIEERVEANRYGCAYGIADENLDWYLKGLRDAGVTDEEVKRIRDHYYSVSNEGILKEKKKN